MNNKKLVVLFFLLLTLVTGVTAVYIGNKLRVQEDLTPTDSSAATKSNGVIDCGNPTIENPGGEALCNNPTDKQKEYCPSYTRAGEQLNTEYDKIKIVYSRDFGLTDMLQLGAEEYSLCEEGGRCTSMEVLFDTPQPSLGMRVFFTHEGKDYYALGWQSPVGDACGSCFHRFQGNCLQCSEYGVLSVSSLPDLDTGFTEIAVQCWGDPPTGDADFDFNDFGFRVMGNNFPECKSLTVEPATASPGSIVTITCEATDDDGIDNVAFSYNISGDTDWCNTSWQSIGEGSNVSGDTYSYEWTLPNIPGEYTIMADVYDTAGDRCTGNPGGICAEEGIGSCPNCNAELIITDITITTTPTSTPSITPTGTIFPTNTPSITPTGGRFPTNTPYDKPTSLPPTALDTPRDKIIVGAILITIGFFVRYNAIKKRQYT